MADQAASYQELRSRILNKPFLSGPYGTGWQTVMGSAMDTELDRLYQAKRVRWPDYAPLDGLYYLGAERGLERTPSDADADYRTRLRNAWYVWQRAGSQGGTQEEFGWTGLTNVQVYRRKDFSQPAPTGSAYVQAFARSVWAQFDVVINKPHPWTVKTWGDGWTWGDGSTWGSSATQDQVERLKRFVRTFKAGHETGTYIHVNTTSGRLWGTWKFGDGGVWGGTGQAMHWIVGETHWAQRGLI